MVTAARLGPRTIVCALLQVLTLISGCSSWQVQAGPVPEVITKQHPHRLRVTRADQSLVVLKDPEIRADTLFEVLAPPAGGQDTSTGQGVALADIRQVAIRRTSEGRTFLLVVGSLVVVVGVAAAIAYSIAANSD